MAGMIEIAPGTNWAAAGWLFRWTVNHLADNATDPSVAEALRQTISENLTSVGIDDFGPAARAELASILRGIAVSAERELPADVPNRQGVLAHLRELAAAAS